MRKGKLVLIIVVPILLLCGAMAYYFFIWRDDGQQSLSQNIVARGEQDKILDNSIELKVFYPEGTELKKITIKSKQTFDAVKTSEAALTELFAGKSIPNRSAIPSDVKLLGLYYGIDKILYVDVSGELQRNFRGDAIAELLLLRSIYETVVSNMDVDDVKVLVNSMETESLGGHFYLKYPLKRIVTQETVVDGSHKSG
ncbi:GerMN domain-containing protein [Candidatus Magnetobacterium casense]|uniref:GerMN domain-containing protein n=1 Tax=Candidatus Magnetobacterium casense TaxID=1455061 RepID=A0ABS6S0P6_9BACT|nr:GerMN domain-containing protein [Candidatus Magnetobacterium casensis]MBV6341964.1 GerMN domain-containing protein [Candidatus Magnetobacterium casensis]